MQIIVSMLVWENCWYFMPSAADEDPILQASLSRHQRGGCIPHKCFGWNVSLILQLRFVYQPMYMPASSPHPLGALNPAYI